MKENKLIEVGKTYAYLSSFLFKYSGKYDDGTLIMTLNKIEKSKYHSNIINLCYTYKCGMNGYVEVEDDMIDEERHTITLGNGNIMIPMDEQGIPTIRKMIMALAYNALSEVGCDTNKIRKVYDNYKIHMGILYDKYNKENIVQKYR